MDEHERERERAAIKCASGREKFRNMNRRSLKISKRWKQQNNFTCFTIESHDNHF